MNTVIAFSPSQLYYVILAVCGGIITVSTAITIIANVIKKAKSPEEKQNERIKHLEEMVAKHEDILSNDNKRLKSMEEGNREIMQAILALLAHGIDGNEIDSLKKAKENLQNYLIIKQ